MEKLVWILGVGALVSVVLLLVVLAFIGKKRSFHNPLAGAKISASGKTIANVVLGIALVLLLASYVSADLWWTALGARWFWVGLIALTLLILNDKLDWLLGLGVILLVIWGFSAIVRSCNGGGKEKQKTETTRAYKPGEVIFDGTTPCHPVIPCGFTLTPTGPVKEVWETTSGLVIQRIGETAPSAPENRLRESAVVITSLTVGTEYHITIVAR